ncbi:MULTISPECIES: glycosyltransferase family 87 protein [unclassified Paraburkholderia]|uniref:glycosyltransferase family 87 protein n=1 Tax=unclassified Paraburkholderia TaxID=2615204 RepID=UPI002AAF81C8|nr:MULTISPECIES: glycosyltransferase family 87 protein [unclassified Paraburkholderia]
MPIPKSARHTIEAVQLNEPYWFTRQRIVLYASILLALDLTYLGLRLWAAYVSHLPAAAFGYDFSVFWSASYIAMHSSALSAYDASLIEHMALSLLHRTPTGFSSPWVYPPVFLLFVWPLSLLPFSLAYLAFFITGVAFVGFACSRIVMQRLNWVFWLPALAFPSVWIVVISGQNSFFTLGLAALGLALLDRRQWLAGICIGLLAIKPQFGIVFPFALLLSRQWRAAIAAAITVGSLCALAGILFGFATFGKFLLGLSQFGHFIVEHSPTWPGGIASVFGCARSLGLSPSISYALQATFAVPAVLFVCYLCLIKARPELRAAAIGMATILAQPYMLGYDLVWLALPILFLIVDGRRHGWLPGDVPVLVAAWLAPLVFLVMGPPVLIVFLALMVILVRRSRIGARGV